MFICKVIFEDESGKIEEKNRGIPYHFNDGTFLKVKLFLRVELFVILVV